MKHVVFACAVWMPFALFLAGDWYARVSMLASVAVVTLIFLGAEKRRPVSQSKEDSA